MTAAERIPFVVIGENVHATRSYARQGRNVALVDGAEQVLFIDAGGASRVCPIAAPIAASADFARNKVKHIRNALVLGLGGGSGTSTALRSGSPVGCRT